VATALKQGKGGPPELAEFDLDQAMWERFGVRANPENLQDWPEQKILDYIEIMQAQAQLARSQMQAPGGGGAAGAPSKADATEEAYRRMKAAKAARQAQQAPPT
jgi:hypothetical protein